MRGIGEAIMRKHSQAESPGGYIREMMEARGWTQSDLAYALGFKQSASVNQILSDKRSISPNLARSLAVIFDCDPVEIARIQAAWDVQTADEPDPAISVRAHILSQYPLREMVKRGWVDPDHRKGTLEEKVCRFFNVKNLSEIPHLSHSAKKTRYDEITPEQLAWLFRVKAIAKEMTAPPFDKGKMAESLETFSALRREPEGVRHVPRLLQKAGVKFVVVEGLAKSAIDGACFWLNQSEPVVGMSFRRDRIDNFWFVLRHECAHVMHGHGQSQAIIDCELGEIDMSAETNEEERVANEEASDFCVSSKKMQSFYLRKKPYFAEREVIAFSKRMDVHPGLVVGQLQRRMDRYDFLRKHLVRVRTTLSESMMMDGWGDLVSNGEVGNGKLQRTTAWHLEIIPPSKCLLNPSTYRRLQNGRSGNVFGRRVRWTSTGVWQTISLKHSGKKNGSTIQGESIAQIYQSGSERMMVLRSFNGRTSMMLRARTLKRAYSRSDAPLRAIATRSL